MSIITDIDLAAITEQAHASTQQLLNALSDIIDEADTTRNVYYYYFRSPTTAEARRSYELRHSHARVDWIDDGHIYSAEYIVQCGARNIYTRGEYTRDGAVTTLTAIRNSYKRLAAAADQIRSAL